MTKLETALVKAIVAQLNTEQGLTDNIKLFVSKVCEAYSWNNLRGDALQAMDEIHAEAMSLPAEQRQLAIALIDGVFDIVEQSWYNQDLALQSLRKIGFAV